MEKRATNSYITQIQIFVGLIILEILKFLQHTTLFIMINTFHFIKNVLISMMNVQLVRVMNVRFVMMDL